MKHIIEDEYKFFIDEITDDTYDYNFGCYLDESDYEDECPNNDIYEAIEMLADRIREYLHTNYPNEFIVSTGWCVHVMTPERARETRISERTIDDYLVR